MPEDIQDKPQNYQRLGEGSSKSSFAKINRNEYSSHTGMEGYDYSFVNVEVTKEGKTKTIRMFSKSIEPSQINERDGRVAPEEILKRHRELKKLDLPVPETLRMSEDGRHILMTDMTQGGKFEIIDRHNEYPGIKIKNLEEVKAKVKEYSDLAKNNGVIFSLDAFAVTVDKETGEGRVVILDLGSGIHSNDKLQEMFLDQKSESKEDYLSSLATNSADMFNIMLDLTKNVNL